MIDQSEESPRTIETRRETRALTGRIWSALATFHTRAGRVDRRCYTIAAVLFAAGIAHLGVQALMGGPWEGPVSWRKPVTFGVSFGLTLATITWVTAFVPLGKRARARLLGLFAAACVAEVTVITVQAWRGVPSHFNMTTPLDTAFAYAAAGGGAVLIVTTVVFASAAFRRASAVPPSMRLAVRAGFVSFLAALAIGAFMIFLGVREARTVSQAAAYTVAAAFKSGHAATMHGILILPALAWLCSFAGWDEARRVRVVALGCAGYLLAAGIVVVDTFIAVNPLAPWSAPVVNTVLAAGATAALLAAGALTVAGVLRSPVPLDGLRHP